MDNASYTNEFELINMDTADGSFTCIKYENEAPLDQPEFYLEDSKEHLNALTEDERICQLCNMICTYGFTPVNNLESDLTCNLNIPMNFGSINEPVICLSCLDSLTTQGSFLNNSSKVQDKITNMSEDKDGSSFIKSEAIDIKSEDEDLNKSEGRDELCGGRTVQNQEVMHKSVPDQLQPTNEDSTETQKYHCDTCSYRSNFRNNFLIHQLKHKDISEVQIYKCGTCAYETKIKNYLLQHQIVHKDSSQVQMYKCHMCNFETKHKRYLKRHQLQHKNVAELQMYDCDTCKFKTPHKASLARHRLIHKNASEVQMYKCLMCTYETKNKHRLKFHELKHKTDSEVQMYKCPTCTYKTKYKKYLKWHELQHKNVSELRMYECDRCKFKTKRKASLVQHQLVHRDASEVKMYKCDTCDFESKRKAAVERHQLRLRCKQVRNEYKKLLVPGV